MNKINLIQDLRKTLGTKVKRLTDGYDDNAIFVDIELGEDISITMYDMPHLLTIADGYNVSIEVYSIDESHLGIYVKEMK